MCGGVNDAIDAIDRLANFGAPGARTCEYRTGRLSVHLVVSLSCTILPIVF